MNRLATPWIFVGPPGSGKASLARKWIEETHRKKLTYPLEVRTFSIGDGYEARVYASPYHFEIDIPNLSMQDKQIIGDLLTLFLSSGDVLNSLCSSTRKLVILRRAHCLSLPAAIRVRAVLQQYVLPQNASGMIWITAREITGPLALLEDAFVRYRVPRIPLQTWISPELKIPEHLRTEEAWNKLEARPERAEQMAVFFPPGSSLQWPRRIQDYYSEMFQFMVQGAKKGSQNLDVILWLRKCVYEALSFCQTGPEIIDSCADAVMRNWNLLPQETFWKVMQALSESEPHTSYRTPLSLEWAMLCMYEEVRKSFTNSRDEIADTSAPTSTGQVPPSVVKGKTTVRKRANNS